MYDHPDWWKEELEEMITAEDVKKKTPALEQLLIEAAKELGLKEAVLFDGTVINLVNKDQGE